MFRRLGDMVDSFPPGRVPLLLLILAFISGTTILARSVWDRGAALNVWTFTHISAQEFSARLPEHPRAAEIRLQNLGTAMFDRLALALMTRTELPDLVEIEQGYVGRFMRGPVEHIPFVDLTERLHAEGWYDQCVPARFARYSVGGRVFGLPHDLHPMVLVYRPDVLAELGAVPEDLSTWAGFRDVAQRFYRPGRPGTQEWRRGLGLHTTEGYDFLVLLWQRGGNLFDADGTVTLDDGIALDTLRFYVDLFRADPPVAGPKLSGLTEDFAALARGQFLVYAAPDWMLAAMQSDMGSLLAGKVQCLPLPAWAPGGRRTSTVGGTALFIPQGTRDPEAAWELAKFLYLDRTALIQRFRTQTIVPPLRTAFRDPAFAEPVAFFQDQQVGLLLTELADEVPAVQGSPYMPEAYKLLDIAIAEVLSGRATPEAALRSAAEQLRATMARDTRALEAVSVPPPQVGS
ncbi:MAG: extracellular solute-binding protein [Phycisphaerales bacterium]|nr:extracellular solute-binding protein [Phycisphaerales bacterium]